LAISHNEHLESLILQYFLGISGEYEIFFKNILLNKNNGLPLQSQILRERYL
jgi:hypothetical protein